MTHATVPSSRRPVGALVVAAAAVALLVYVLRRSTDIEGLLDVRTERAIALLLRLDEAKQTAGFPEGRRFLEPTVFKDPATGLHENLDDPGIAFPMPMRGEVVFEDLPVHAAARLRVGYGIERVANGAGLPITFSVVAVARGADGATGGRHELLRRDLVAPEVGAPPSRAWADAALPAALVGERVDLVFRTDCPVQLDGDALYPAFLSPTLHSEGVARRLESITRTFEEVVDDLLARYERAIDADDQALTLTVARTEDTCFAIRRDADGTTELLPIEPTAVDPSMEPDPSAFAARGGPRPAVVFGWEGPVVRYDVAVPEEGRPRLRFAIGVDHRAVGVGAASFAVDVDGEPAFAETLDPGRDPDDVGWHEREVDLAAFAGRTVRVVFSGEAEAGGPRRIELEDRPPLGAPVRYELEVRRVRAGFARPRVVRDVTVRPRHSKRGERRSVVLVNVETLRSDALHVYGGERGVSPAIDRLADEGTRIEQCVTSSSWTAPSVASLLTGLHPQSHGVTSYARTFLADAVETLAERARRDGVATAAFVTNSLLSRRNNFDQGFDDFLECPEANARQIVATFEDWLQDHRELQFFAYLHLFEPHDRCDAPGEDRERYVPADLRGQDDREVLGRVLGAWLDGRPPRPEDEDVRFLRGRYLGEVAYLDRQIARLRAAIESAGLAGRVTLVFTSDHGEEFGEHGMVGHGSQLYGETVLVPLIFWGDGVPAGRVLRGPVGNRRVFGAVLDLLGAPADPARDPGMDLAAANVGGGMAYAVTEQAILDVAPPDLWTRSRHLVRTGEAAFHYSPRAAVRGPDGEAAEQFPAWSELFRLDEDRSERHDLGASAPELRVDMKERMIKAHRIATTGPAAELPESAADAVRAQVAQLGYATGATADEGGLFEEEEPEGGD